MNRDQPDLNWDQGTHSSPATDCANRVLWRASVLLLGGMIGLLVVLWDRSLSFALVGGTGSIWCVVAGVVYYFFRDPEPNVPMAPSLLVSPAHGLVDEVDEASNLEFMGGPCRRISIFLSVLDVHVQYAPAAGRVVVLEHHAGRFLSALRTQSAQYNENVLIGIECGDGISGRVAVRQIAGVIARRIVSWTSLLSDVERGQRLGLIQFGSRCDLYLPLSVRLRVRRGDRVVGGETVVGEAVQSDLDEVRLRSRNSDLFRGRPAVPGGHADEPPHVAQ